MLCPFPILKCGALRKENCTYYVRETMRNLQILWPPSWHCALKAKKRFHYVCGTQKNISWTNFKLEKENQRERQPQIPYVIGNGCWQQGVEPSTTTTQFLRTDTRTNHLPLLWKSRWAVTVCFVCVFLIPWSMCNPCPSLPFISVTPGRCKGEAPRPLTMT